MTTQQPTEPTARSSAHPEQDAEFLNHFRSMSQIGATAGGGVDRQAATLADGQTRHWFRGIVESLGMTVHYDRVGNQFALLELVPGAPFIALGSHLDSQPLGGRFDGAYGVLAGAHAVIRASRAAAAQGAPAFNLCVVNWFNEEGCRFKPSMMGSAVFTGKLDADAALDTADPAGVTVREALEAIGTVGDFRVDLAAYLEIHIEQGRVLEDSGMTIGLVESTWGANKYEFVVHGEQAHTGATVIADRQDALLGASAMVVAARAVANDFSTPDAEVITSCGEFTVFPNSPVVVASRVSLLMDLRSTDPEALARADAALFARIREIEVEANVQIERGAEHIWGAKAYDERGMELAAACAEELGLSHRVVRTLAGHDSTNLKDLVPTIMLFIPSAEGISHNEREFTSDADMLAGVDLLTAVTSRVLRGEFVPAP